ncbi:hypothetical protein J7T55_008158 [Diaporthe amygdali]|uniref:uncharacterized protein n=1 Tax=Phomopsis amygdali TaxID=1214568 RepID=UPI0022FDD88A|nr:uncharacterized protein J7T55_008158 [Diaporthe amygdali]KAJ0108022.1 hypothetical protein J7T55_008158 [Diaporthe amygdali]
MGLQDTEIVIPGTEVVYRETDGDSNSSRELVLIPNPTNNEDDPLNWSVTWKTIVIVNQFVFVFVSILTTLSIAPLTQIFEAEFHKSIPQVNLLFGVAAITLGYANFIIVPLANCFGRRPIVIICGTICVLANVWQALVTSFPSFIGARVLSGLGAGANESLMPMVICDLLFVHQRGRSMALYFWAYFIGVFIGPVISGSIAAQSGWRWFFWACAILQAASLVFLIIAHPETKYERLTVSSASETETQSGNSNAADKQVGPQAPTHGPSTTSGLRHFGRPSLVQFSLLPIPRFSHGLGQILRDVVSPIQIFSFPIVLWASFTMGFAANSALALNLTESQVFAAPPYLFNSAQIGYTNFAFAVGAVLALLTAGPLSDWVALRRAKRNGGVLEAEMRLLSLVPYVGACLVGMVVTAVGYQRGWPWEAVVIVGYGMVGLETVGIPSIVISYAVDSYKSLPGEIMIAATVVKNTFGFGMVFFFNDWAAKHGFIAPLLTLMAATVGLSVLGLAVFIPYGKRFRVATKNSALVILQLVILQLIILQLVILQLIILQLVILQLVILQLVILQLVILYLVIVMAPWAG